MAIDVGPSCSDRGDATGGHTLIMADNPANADGTIDYICTYANFPASTEFYVGIFTNVSGNQFTRRDYTGDLGSLIANSQNEFNAPGDFTALDIKTGDLIGYYADDNVEMDSSGGGGYYYWASHQAIDPFDDDTADGFLSGRVCSIYATGTESGAGWTGAFIGVTNPGKVLGVAVANIAKIIGVS